MGAIKELLTGKLSEANLSDEQCDEVMEILADLSQINDVNTSIDLAIATVKCGNTVSALKKEIHDLNNKYCAKFAIQELQTMALVKALKNIINFEFGAFVEAKELLKKMGETI